MTTGTTAAETAAPGAPSANRVNGVYDLPAPGRVAGWAIDRANPEAVVEVEIRRAGKLIAKTRADRHRPDLERGGIGTGRYGFSVEIDPPIEPGMAFTLSVLAMTGDGVSGPLRGTGAAAQSEDPSRRILEQTFAEIAALRADLDDLRHAIADVRAPAAERNLAETLERIEVVQARLDLVAAAPEAPSVQRTQSGLRWAVAASLLIGTAALALGLWSVLA